MRKRPTLVGCAVVATWTLLAGCGQVAGAARPDDSAPATFDTGDPTPTPTVALPPRPQRVDLDAVSDPCALLTTAQQVLFGINRFRPDEDTGFGHAGCQYKVDAHPPRYGFTVTAKPDFDARRLLTGEIGRRAKVTSAAGFPAVGSRPGLYGDTNLSCFINVDVADGQSLEVQSLLISTEAFTSDEMCEKTRLVAEAAMATLLNRQ
jgi:hypothetical protein